MTRRQQRLHKVKKFYPIIKAYIQRPKNLPKLTIPIPNIAYEKKSLKYSKTTIKNKHHYWTHLRTNGMIRDAYFMSFGDPAFCNTRKLVISNEKIAKVKPDIVPVMNENIQ